jgi:hypothetical protein
MGYGKPDIRITDNQHSSTVGGLVGRPGSHQPPIPGRTCTPSPAGRPGRRELASSSREDRVGPCQIQASPLQPSFFRPGRLEERRGKRPSDALGPCILGAEARRSVQSRSAGKTRRCDFARCCHKKKTQSRRRYCAWQTCCQLPKDGANSPVSFLNVHLPISKKRPLTLESQMLHFQAAAKLAAFENSPSFIMRNLSTDGQTSSLA